MQSLVHAYVDGELDLMTNLRIEQHLAGCPECSEVYKSQQALHSALGTGSLYYRAPRALEESIRASIHKAGKAESPPLTAPRLPWRLFAIAAAVAAVLIAAVGILALVRAVPGTPGNEGVAQEVVASHIRSLMGNHLEDVASTDQHTVKPWFDGKLDFSPTVNDFSAQGFPLVGGRLDYLANRPVAALVYGRHKHFINLFIWPERWRADASIQTTESQGYQVFYWTKADDLLGGVRRQRRDLGQFVQLVQGGRSQPQCRRRGGDNCSPRRRRDLYHWFSASPRLCGLGILILEMISLCALTFWLSRRPRRLRAFWGRGWAGERERRLWWPSSRGRRAVALPATCSRTAVAGR